MGTSKKYGMNTKAIHTKKRVELPTGDVMPPIHLSTTFENTQPGEYEYFYGRSGNPTRELFERTMASLEGVEDFESMHSFGMASGMAAVTLIGELVEPGENVVITRDVYGGTTRFFSQVMTKRGIEVNFCDLYDEEKLTSLINEKTKLVWFESPSNPRINIFDISKYAEIVHKSNAYLVADGTFTSPFITRHLEHGVDIVFHSTTKYIGGHSDTLGGVVTTNNEKVWEILFEYQKTSGAIMSPFDAYLCQRGLYTLGPRLSMHSANAHKLAEYLENSEHIKEVFYPGLQSNPHYLIAEKQMDMFGGMLSFNVEDNINLKLFWENLELFKLAVSLGGVESLIELPRLMTHDSAEGTEASIDDDLVRISVGLENTEDLISDLESALNAAKK
ncbi:PLP-dependent aspartate aminotransferase family protein [bacterium]|nr:PLP-dependent aspartate aminotransferase family protein [bacterium]MDA8719512.1 PLP-dependent aspartate aminotransferase family protein [Candidatus Actinomarina sp.]MDC0471525.1 PLP-dependent aspartate aminotransferase family protein [Acidimicrobiia bacterium]